MSKQPDRITSRVAFIGSAVLTGAAVTYGLMWTLVWWLGLPPSFSWIGVL